jgi:streptomycin 6-kinase
LFQDVLRSNITAIYGDIGIHWLQNLPQHLARLSTQWGLMELNPVENMTFNYVTKAIQGKRDVVLKLSLETDSLYQEMTALKHFAGRGAAEVINYEDGALLLESVQSGKSLKNAHYDNCTKIQICCELAQCLHEVTLPIEHSFSSFHAGLSILDHEWSLPPQYLECACSLRDSLLSNPYNEKLVLLHGDLHHDNILSDTNSWCVIDPKGVVGFSINEYWSFVMDVEKDTQYIALFFGYDVLFVRQWYFVHVILAACWNLENNLSADLFLDLAAKTHKLI